MSFPRYPKYKDSGVEWLGEVPEHWVAKKVRAISSLKGRLGWQGLKADEYRDDGPYVVSSAHFENHQIQWDECPRVSQERYDTDNHIQLSVDDLLLMKDGAAMGKLAFVDSLPGPACLNSHLLLFRPVKADRVAAYFPRFTFYFMQTGYFQEYIKVNGTGATFLGVSQDMIGRYMIALPPLLEQTAIAAFLDRETAKIDELVAEQRRLMELLKEKRQAVISHAVTKGLNPNARMKPSGIEWLGDVPAHWRVMPMRMVANVVRGASPRPAGDPRYFGGDAVPWVTVAEITKDDAVYLTGTEDFLTEEGATHSSLFRSGTLIYSNSGATLGVPKILRIDACANDGVVAFLNLNCEIQSEFLYHYLSSITECIREKVKQGSGQPNLNTDIVKDLRFGVPPLNEQKSIVCRIGELAGQFGTLSAEAQRAIDLLQERRTALISAAVTGQIDVRHVTAK